MITALRAHAAKHAATVWITSSLTLMIGGCTMHDDPYKSETVKGDQATAVIDSMRDKGSYQAARDRINATAQRIAERISAAVPGQTWQWSDDPHGQEITRLGLSCDQLTGDIALRPLSDTVRFGRTFSPEEIKTAAGIVRQEAAPYGATQESSLFNDQTKRDYAISGNGFEFQLGQIKRATLNITGDCFLLQRTLDLPPGQLPPEPPIVPTEVTPTP